MDNAVLQIRISKKLKKQSMIVSENLGFTTSTLIKLFLAHVVQKRKIPFEIEEIPNAKFAREIRQAEKEIVSRDLKDYLKFDSMDSAIQYLKEYVKPKKNHKRLSKKILPSKTKTRPPINSKISFRPIATV
ncbi:MAG: type II toxin-antitoxin system RelB/DinJ family antitoxin [bacterium]